MSQVAVPARDACRFPSLQWLLMGKEIQKWPSWLYLVPVSGTATAGKLELLDGTLGVSAIFLSLLFLIPYGFTIAPKRLVMDQYKAPEDFPFPWGRIIFPFVAMFLGLIGLPASGMPVELANALLLAGGTAAGTLSFHTMSTVHSRDQRSRIRMLLAQTKLEDLTIPRLEAIAKHRALALKLLRCGAFDGVRVRVSNVSDDFENVLAAGAELEKQGLASVSSMMYANDRSKWWIELTALGVQVLGSKR